MLKSECNALWKSKNLTAESLMIRDYAKLSKGNWSEIRQLELIDIEMIAEGVYFAEAIPLTDKVLEKNNFEKHYDDDIIIYTHPQCIIIEMGINYKLFDDGHFFVRGILQRFYFVHELQRALKLLKINKDIVL